MATIKARNKELIRQHMVEHGLECDLNHIDVSDVTDMSYLFYYSEQEFTAVLNKYNESPLGYIGVLQGYYEFPKDHPCAAQFHELRSLCDGLNMDPLSAAQLIYQRIHQISLDCTEQEYNNVVDTDLLT